jgi:hypothetical protein
VSILGFGAEKTAVVLNYDCGKKESSRCSQLCGRCSAEALLRSDEGFNISVLMSTDRRVFR